MKRFHYPTYAVVDNGRVLESDESPMVKERNLLIMWTATILTLKPIPDPDNRTGYAAAPY
jgi:hypothetical protein